MILNKVNMSGKGYYGAYYGSITGNIMESITGIVKKADCMRRWCRKGQKAPRRVKGKEICIPMIIKVPENRGKKRRRRRRNR